jgi:hypothetical protein
VCSNQTRDDNIFAKYAGSTAYKVPTAYFFDDVAGQNDCDSGGLG